MKAAIFNLEHSLQSMLDAVAAGLRRHGIEVAGFKGPPAPQTDFVVTWGWGRAVKVKKAGFTGPVLVIERGYIGDRLNVWTSMGWDGLNGRARFPAVHDASRFEAHFAGLLKPWKAEGGYALVLGQVEGDQSIAGVKINEWYNAVATRAWKSGWDVKFRPHPRSVERGYTIPRVSFAERIDGDLATALAGAGIAVTYNSNSGVDAILAGCPVHAEDEGSMVFGLASQNLVPIRASREARLNEIANVQWMADEIASGKAWEYVREAMP